MSTTSERMVFLAKKRGLSQKEVAQRAGVTESAVSYYMNGTRSPQSAILARVATALNTTVGYLLGQTDDPEIPDARLGYIQRNLGKLNDEDLRRAETILKAAFTNIFDEED